MNIKTILNKKTWRGDEVGKALIASLINDIVNAGKDWKPLFPQSEYNRMVDSLQTEVQIGKYLVYEKIYSSVMDYYNRNQAMIQQFWHGYYRLLCSLEQIQQANSALKAIEQYPLIMTRQQYARLSEEVRKENAAQKMDFHGIMFHYLQFCLIHPDETPDSILKALAACKKESADNERILDAYRDNWHGGFYLRLPDGTTNKDTTTEQWKQAVAQAWAAGKHAPLGAEGVDAIIKRNHMEKRIEFIAAAYKGIDALRAYFQKTTGESFCKDSTDEELQDLAEELLNDINYNGLSYDIIEKVKTDEPVTKYDALAASGMVEHYSGEDQQDGLTATEQLAEFKADYPNLYKILCAETKKLLGIKTRAIPKKKYTIGDLAEQGLLDFDWMVEPSDRQIIAYYVQHYRKAGSRAEYAGIAIMSDKSGVIVNEAGDVLDLSENYASLEALDNMTIEEQELIDGYQNTLIIPALKSMTAYNKLLEILADLYDIPNLTEAGVKVEQFIEKVKIYNALLYMTYSSISGTPAEKRKRRQILQDGYRPIDIEALASSESKAEEIKNDLARLQLTRAAALEIKRNFDNYINELMTADEDEGGAEYE